MLDPLDLLERVQDARDALLEDDTTACDLILAELEDALIRAGRAA